MNGKTSRLARRWLFSCLLLFAAPFAAQSRQAGDGYAREHYTKSEQYIEMRDGVKLFTAIYAPKDKSKKYPILLNRTPYSCRPYGEDLFKRVIGPSRYAMEAGYIVVYQDVRGRYMSEGLYDNMRPHIPNKKGKKQIDESSDTYDTIDWLVKNVEGNNGRVGMWGISYPGFYTAAAIPDAHPALKASSPQAPIADFFFDDFHHQGAYFLSYWLATPVFGYQKEGPTKRAWYPFVRPETRDGYKFYMDLGPLKNASKHFGPDNFFWQQLVEHPNYDAFWQKRNLLPHLKHVKHAVMTVGGLFDAEDLYGPFNIYRTLESENPGIFNILVMGPWSHGDWARTPKTQTVGYIAFGDSISYFFQREVELKFFEHFLKDAPDPGLPEALVFDTGRKAWQRFDQWPPQAAKKQRYYFHPGEILNTMAPDEPNAPYSEFLSDPQHPVPYTSDIRIVFTPRKYMTDDQRFATRRPDVLTFQTEVLQEDITLAGDILAHLTVSTTGTAADWVVKLIDVYPSRYPKFEHNPKNIVMGDYQQLVRSEVIRGRFRNSYSKPEPFVPNKMADINLPLQAVLHTFKKGHRIMIHVQSTWFPLVDRNPQKYVDNIFKADAADFIKATHRVYHSKPHPSYVEVRILPQPPGAE